MTKSKNNSKQMLVVNDEEKTIAKNSNKRCNKEHCSMEAVANDHL